ncbi:MAG: hypothetical protein LH467_08520 [Gemmatimonadaceae bacterium]|nr:hypothetical protein [Gemmatimonadaceae bacterium]
MAFTPEVGDAWLRSPGSRPCLTIEGDADAIEAAGVAFRNVGFAMRRAALELGKLSREESYRAQSFDAIRDEAGQAETDLDQAAKRYVGEYGTTGTAKALCDYAVSLRRVQFLAGEGHVEHIRRAHEANEERQSAFASAQREVSGLDGLLRFTEPTEAERTSAQSDLTQAETLAGGTESLLMGLWENFDSAVGEWEAAYEDAVASIEGAIDLSDIDDSWWEDALDVGIFVATVVGVAAAIFAMVVMSPIALAIATVAAIVVLAATIVMALGGRRKDGVDVAFAVIGVIPFGKALKAGNGLRSALGLTTRASTGTAAAGRAVIADDLVRWQSRGSTHRAVLSQHGNRAARQASAPDVAENFLQSKVPDWALRIGRGIRSSGNRDDIDAMRVSALLQRSWASGGTPGQRSVAWAAENSMPSLAMQGVNTWNLTNSATDGLFSDILGQPARDAVDMVEHQMTGR